MAEFVLRSVRKIIRADWLRNGPIFYVIGAVHYNSPMWFLLRSGKFWQENLRAHFNAV